VAKYDRDRLESYGTRDERTGCLLWQGASRTGYGVVRMPGHAQPVALHRLMLERKLGRQLEGGECALHRCDTPSCYEPDHLFLGTAADNNADTVRKGRARRRVKLTDAQVREIRVKLALGYTQTEIGAAYGVTHACVSHIKLGRTRRTAGRANLVDAPSDSAQNGSG
jgi:hypothetical protein